MSSHRKVLLAAAVALFALPAEVFAVTPPAGALFGGGAIGATYDPTSVHDVTWVGIRMSKDRKRLTFYGDVDLVCSGKHSVILTTTDAKLLSGGRFSATNTVDPAMNSGIGGTLKFSGRFTSRGAASGSIQTATTLNGAACQSRKLSWDARSPVLAPHHSGAKTGGTYFGTTKQTFSALVRTDRSGRRLKQASIEYLYTCRSGKKNQYGNEVTPGTRLSKTGTFTGHDHFSHPYQNTPGLTGHWVSTVHGKVKGDRATGTWNVKITVTKDSDGSVVDTCSTGTIAWTAAK